MVPAPRILQLLHGLRHDAADALAHLGVEAGEGLPPTPSGGGAAASSRARPDARVAAAVAQHLDLDVAGLLEVLLDIDRVVAEGGLGLGLAAFSA
jgi:hypothetical protein